MGIAKEKNAKKAARGISNKRSVVVDREPIENSHVIKCAGGKKSISVHCLKCEGRICEDGKITGGFLPFTCLSPPLPNGKRMVMDAVAFCDCAIGRRLKANFENRGENVPGYYELPDLYIDSKARTFAEIKAHASKVRLKLEKQIKEQE